MIQNNNSFPRFVSNQVTQYFSCQVFLILSSRIMLLHERKVPKRSLPTIFASAVFISRCHTNQNPKLNVKLIQLGSNYIHLFSFLLFLLTYCQNFIFLEIVDLLELDVFSNLEQKILCKNIKNKFYITKYLSHKYYTITK